jgi:hypothetical protein
MQSQPSSTVSWNNQNGGHEPGMEIKIKEADQ